MQEHDDKAGRQLMRMNFVERLARAGLERPRGMTEADLDQMMRRLVRSLSYLSAPSVEVLADQVLEAASGPKRSHWPSELIIRQMAQALEPRPLEDRPIVASWLGSVEGPRAIAGGYLVELLRWLRSHPRPIMPHDLRCIHEQASDNRRRRQIINERRRAGDDRAEDRSWMLEYAEDERQALGIIERAQAARQAREDQQALEAAAAGGEV